MERLSKFRAVMLVIIICAILFFFAVRLFSLQIIATDGNTDNTSTYTTLTRVKAARGDILDRNGNVLVGNRASYDLVFNHYVIKSADNTNEHLYTLVKKCQELGIEYNDHFPVTAQRPFEYNLNSFSATWRNYFQSFMRDRELDSDMSAPLLVSELRSRYKIPDTWSDEDARAVIALRYEFDLRGVVPSLSNYVFIEDVSEENLSTLLELNIPGLMVEASTVREYYTTYCAHILGSVGAIDADEWADYKAMGYAMDAFVGKSGFEAAFESDLRAIDGTRVDVVDKSGTIISQYYSKERDSETGEVISVNEPIAGNNVETTIDLKLQIAAEDAMAKVMQRLRDPVQNTEEAGRDAEGCAVVVMDVKTGEILAMASYPTFDLATLNQSYAEIENADFAPLFNRALSAAYPPGSTYKMSTLIAAFNNGLADSTTIIRDMGVWTKYEDFYPTCLAYSQYGYTHQDCDGEKALEVSCNYYFYELGSLCTIDMLDNTAKALGLGEPTGQELPEVYGHRSNAESKAAEYKGLDTVFSAGDRVLTSIGQSENRFTPMQLCVYAATLANKGTRMKATFLNRVVSSDYHNLVRENTPVVANTLEIKEDAVTTYFNGMRRVISGDMGTGRAYFGGNKDGQIGDTNGVWPYPEIHVCAKTGTAQTFKDRSDNGAYICFAPMEDPEIAVAVYGERVGGGAKMAEIAEAVLREYFDLGDAGDTAAYENQLN